MLVWSFHAKGFNFLFTPLVLHNIYPVFSTGIFASLVIIATFSHNFCFTTLLSSDIPVVPSSSFLAILCTAVSLISLFAIV